MTIHALRRKAKSLNVKKIAAEAVTSTIDQLETKNKRQLFEGFNRTGERLKPYASSAYAFFKSNRNPIPGLGNPDLFDTGAFFAGFTFTVTGERIIEESTDKKNAELTAKYRDIFGLGGRFKQQYLDESLKPEFQNRVEASLGLKFK